MFITVSTSSLSVRFFILLASLRRFISAKLMTGVVCLVGFLLFCFYRFLPIILFSCSIFCFSATIGFAKAQFFVRHWSYFSYTCNRRLFTALSDLITGSTKSYSISIGFLPQFVGLGGTKFSLSESYSLVRTVL